MFGTFSSVEDFLDSYINQKKQKEMALINALAFEDRAAALRSIRIRETAEVKATVKERQPDEGTIPKHYHLIIILNEIMEFSPEIKDDILKCKQDSAPVFVAIRYGDREGISQPIDSGMENGDLLHLKGEWITKENAYSHGGDKMSVLHFTHHPLGFTCTVEKCYS